MPSRPAFTREACILGARLMVPLLPGLIVYACAFGAAAVQKGLTLGEAFAMQVFVFAGASQMVSLELWQPSWSGVALLTMMIVTFTVNARMILMGASLQPWLAGSPKPLIALQLFFLTDGNWLRTMRYRAEGGTDLGFLLGAGLITWTVWSFAVIPGYVAGSLVKDPFRYGLDLVMPIYFFAMLVPLWRGRSAMLPWIVAGIVALVVQALVPGYLFVAIGAVAGAATGALMHGGSDAGRA